jgi:hypothetical protein
LSGFCGVNEGLLPLVVGTIGLDEVDDVKLVIHPFFDI